MKHSRNMCLGALTACLFAAGCSGSRPAPASPATAPTPAEEAAPAAPVNELDREAPAAGAAPAPESAAPSSSKAVRDRQEVPELETWGKQLDSALTLSTPDCNTAWALRDRICDLSQRLCDLASRSAEPEVAERCADGRARCERATAKVRASCAE